MSLFHCSRTFCRSGCKSAKLVSIVTGCPPVVFNTAAFCGAPANSDCGAAGAADAVNEPAKPGNNEGPVADAFVVVVPPKSEGVESPGVAVAPENIDGVADVLLAAPKS